MRYENINNLYSKIITVKSKKISTTHHKCFATKLATTAPGATVWCGYVCVWLYTLQSCRHFTTCHKTGAQTYCTAKTGPL